MRLLSLVKKEFRQYRRDKRMLVVSFLAPIFQLAIFGYATNLDVRDVRVAICDQDLSRESMRLVAEIEQSRFFRVSGRTQRASELVAMLDRGLVQLTLRIPPGFGTDLRHRGGTQLQVIIDGSDANTAGIGASYLVGLLAEHGVRARTEQLERAGAGRGGLPAVTIAPRILYNPALLSVYYMVPGVLGVVLLVVTGMTTALSIVKEREIGTLEQVMVTPVRPWEIIVSKLIPYTLIGCLDLLVVLTVIVCWFDIPLRGELWLLLFAALTYLLTCVGIGLLVSTVSSTQNQAQMSFFFIVMPMVLLAGFIFPIANMPGWMQPATYCFPLRYFLKIIRDVMLKGSGITELWFELLMLTFFGLALVVIGSRLFRKRLG